MEIYREMIDIIISFFIFGGLAGICYVGFSVVVSIFSGYGRFKVIMYMEKYEKMKQLLLQRM